MKTAERHRLEAKQWAEVALEVDREEALGEARAVRIQAVVLVIEHLRQVARVNQATIREALRSQEKAAHTAQRPRASLAER